MQVNSLSGILVSVLCPLCAVRDNLNMEHVEQDRCSCLYARLELLIMCSFWKRLSSNKIELVSHLYVCVLGLGLCVTLLFFKINNNTKKSNSWIKQWEGGCVDRKHRIGRKKLNDWRTNKIIFVNHDKTTKLKNERCERGTCIGICALLTEYCWMW